jgi:hypothetical protein
MPRAISNGAPFANEYSIAGPNTGVTCPIHPRPRDTSQTLATGTELPNNV